MMYTCMIHCYIAHYERYVGCHQKVQQVLSEEQIPNMTWPKRKCLEIKISRDEQNTKYKIQNSNKKKKDMTTKKQMPYNQGF